FVLPDKNAGQAIFHFKNAHYININRTFKAKTENKLSLSKIVVIFLSLLRMLSRIFKLKVRDFFFTNRTLQLYSFPSLQLLKPFPYLRANDTLQERPAEYSHLNFGHGRPS
ncbi:MAG: hypothetical protein ACI85O_001748, partial [Saprospiraceae bacterium]